MLQQIIAFFIIAFFLARLFWQKQKKQIGINEFLFWLFFWLLVGLAIAFIRFIDSFVAKLGFTSSGIDVLLYLSIALLFYLIFRLRLRLTKIERNITKITREISLNSERKK